MDQLVIFAFETIIDDKNKNSEEKIQILNLCLEFGVDINHGTRCYYFLQLIIMILRWYIF